MNSRPYELQSLRYGEYCVLVEFCSNCKEHNSSLRHDEQKYYEKAVNIKTNIQNEFPFIKVFLRPLNTTLKDAKKRLGLFEVSFGSFESNGFMLMASKLKTLKWPETKTVINNIRAQLKTKTVTIELKLPKNKMLHPRNEPLAGIKPYLVSAYDFPTFIQNFAKIRDTARTSKTAKPDFKKERTLSSVVKRKIESGETKSEEIDELLQSKEYVYKLSVEDGLIEHNNVSPGNFVFCLIENKNFKMFTQEIYIAPNVRDNDRHQHEEIELEIQDLGVLDLKIGCEDDNPVIAINFRPKEQDFKEVTNSSYMSLDNDLVKGETTAKGGQLITNYKAQNLKPGIYDLFLEYRDYSTFQTEVIIFNGQNEYTLIYPEMRLDTEYQPGKERQHKPKSITPKTEMPVIIENPRGEDRFDATATKREGESEVFDQKKTLMASNDEFDKENFDNNIRDSITSKSKHKSELNHSNTSFESKSSKRPVEEFHERPIVSKNRITSGNRIRPGERLTSAKSNNMAPTVHNELVKDKEYITVFTNSIVNDIVWDSLDYEQDKFNIFIKDNKTVELRLDFVLEDDDLGDVINESKSSGYKHVILSFTPKIKLVRMYIEKLKDKIDERFDIYINNKGRTTKIEISEFMIKNMRKDEKYCDICILCSKGRSYDDFVLLVPLRARIQNVSGLVELKNIVSFVKNSKFDVFKFFGFDEAQSADSQDQAISFKEASDNLNNYEIYCNDNYILNSIRYHDKELVSMRRLEKIYPIWAQLVLATKDILANLEEAIDEDEPFEPDEFEESDFD